MLRSFSSLGGLVALCAVVVSSSGCLGQVIPLPGGNPGGDPSTGGGLSGGGPGGGVPYMPPGCGGGGEAGGGGYGYAYAYSYASGPIPSPPEEVRHVVLERGNSAEFRFLWYAAPGCAPPEDLGVFAGRTPLFQVAALDDHPFARAGLELVTIRPEATYRLVFTRGDEGYDLTLRDEAGRVLVHVESGTDAPVELVLPGGFARKAIVLQGGETER